MAKIYTINHLEYIGKLSDISLFLDFAAGSMQDADVKARALGKWMSGIDDFFMDDRFFKQSVTQEQRQEFIAKRVQAIRDSYLKKFDDGGRIVLNMGLVMSCTILELFFEHVFFTLLDANPKTLLSLSEEKTITLQQLVQASTLNDAIQSIKEKSVDQIIRKGTKTILDKLDFIGIKTAAIFSWEHFKEDVKVRFQSWDENKLIDIFNERHAIVHDNSYSINNMDEYLLRKEFFDKIISSLSLLIWKKFYTYGVILDSHQKIREALQAEGKDPSNYPPPPEF
jgi:hypothetical protein